MQLQGKDGTVYRPTLLSTRTREHLIPSRIRAKRSSTPLDNLPSEVLVPEMKMLWNSPGTALSPILRISLQTTIFSSGARKLEDGSIHSRQLMKIVTKDHFITGSRMFSGQCTTVGYFVSSSRLSTKLNSENLLITCRLWTLLKLRSTS